jgi:hypothetical protein
MSIIDEIRRKAALAIALREATWDGVDRRLRPRDHDQDAMHWELRAMRRALVDEIREDCRAMRLWSR